MNKKNFYITTTLPYVNADPHIGFALEIIQADVIARTHRLLGEEVIFNFGTDEHGLKIYRKAVESGKTPQEYCDYYAARFDALKQALNLSYSHFIRTTDPHHVVAAQEFWKLCLDNGDIYKKNYQVKYCVGCELEKTDSELVEGKCPLHPTYTIELINEENYFFKFSKYQKALLELYENNSDFVKPEGKLNEIRAFVERGLEDFSISRLKAKMPWGIDVPGDETQVMYVWFDALINYISTLGWPDEKSDYQNFWPGIQVAGKDNLRQQTAIWQAMLLSAGLPSTKQVFIHGFLTVDGQKISKSLGNAIDPIEFANKHGTDALRYFLLAKVHPWEDTDFTLSKFIEIYNADLANGLGNLVARVAKLAEKTELSFKNHVLNLENEIFEGIVLAVSKYTFDEATRIIWQWISEVDAMIETDKPWKLEGQGLAEVMDKYIKRLLEIATALQPFLPDTAEKILKQFKAEKIVAQPPMFLRLK